MALAKQKKYKEYCPECGSYLIRVPIPAEKARVLCCYGLDCYFRTLGSRFNESTGLRQFGIRVKCLNAKWYNHCTDYIDEDSLHDSNLPELLNI